MQDGKPTKIDKRNDKVRKAVEAAEAKFKALGVQYCIVAVDRNEEDPQGGSVFHTAEIQGDDFIHVLQAGLKTKQDVIAMGVHLARLMTVKEREIRDKLKPGGVTRTINSVKNKYKNKH